MGQDEGVSTPAVLVGPRRFAVVGSPIGHSLSPVMHRAAYGALGVADVSYEAHDVPAGGLETFLVGPVGASLSGLSVTMPLKHEAFAIAAEHDAVADALGIANTLVRRADGSWRAENHDVHGIVAAIGALGAPAPRTASVIGSGATALSAVAALAELGVRELVLTARRQAPLESLVAHARTLGMRPRIEPWDTRTRALDVEAAVCALALEGARDLARELREDPAAPHPAVLMDVLYEPWPAPVAAVLGPRGSAVASGLEMLAHQARRQVESMLPVPEAPVEPMLEAARAVLAARA